MISASQMALISDTKKVFQLKEFLESWLYNIFVQSKKNARTTAKFVAFPVYEFFPLVQSNPLISHQFN